MSKGLTMTQSEQKAALLECLAYQRSSILSIVDGLSEADWHRSVVPSGWTTAGFVEHIASAERFWFLVVVDQSNVELPWDEGRPAYDPSRPFTCDRSSSEVLAHYADVRRRCDEVLARVSLDDEPKYQPPWYTEPVKNVREVVLHIIEETAAHSGHLEIARELLDGVTGRGLR